jgi:hypothetical protein
MNEEIGVLLVPSGSWQRVWVGNIESYNNAKAQAEADKWSYKKG